MNESNGGRDTEAVRTGTSVENALYLRPHVGYQVREDLVADLAVLAARAAVLPEDETTGEGYGIELDASIRYDPVAHAWTQATVGVLLPGKYFTEYEHEDLGGDFDQPVLGVQVLGTVEF